MQPHMAFSEMPLLFECRVVDAGDGGSGAAAAAGGSGGQGGGEDEEGAGAAVPLSTPAAAAAAKTPATAGKGGSKKKGGAGSSAADAASFELPPFDAEAVNLTLFEGLVPSCNLGCEASVRGRAVLYLSWAQERAWGERGGGCEAWMGWCG